MPNIGAPKYIKKILEDFRKHIDSNTITVGDFNTPLSKMDRYSKQNINKDIVSLNNTLEEMDLTYIYIYIQLFIPRIKIHILFKCPWNFFNDRPHDRTQSKTQQIQENWNQIKHFLRPKVLKLETNLKEKTQKHSNSWGLNNMLLNTELVK